MKDVVLKGRIVKREIIIYVVCLVVTYLLNIYAIATYDNTSWKELYQVWYAVLFVSFVLYGLTILVRLILWGLWALVRPLVCRKRCREA